LSLWATARYDLRLSDAEFYALTPREFDALVKRDKRHTEHEEYMFAQLTAVVMNTGFRSREEPAQPKDYMPSQWRKTPASKSSEALTDDRRAEIANRLDRMFGALVTRNG
jgi:hypothetical protein